MVVASAGIGPWFKTVLGTNDGIVSEACDVIVWDLAGQEIGSSKVWLDNLAFRTLEGLGGLRPGITNVSYTEKRIGFWIQINK